MTTKVLVVLLASTTLFGCGAMTTAIEHRNLDVQTKASATIFLNPVSNTEKTIYVQIKNTSDKADFHVSEKIKSALSQKGYKVVNNIDRAHYLLQANILQVGKSDPKKARGLLASGYGQALGGFGTGVLAAGALGSNLRTGLAAGLIGGILSTAANAMVKDVFYSVITDVQISERTEKGIKTTSTAKLKQGSSNRVTQNITTQSHWQRYQTRIMSSAEKVNLDFEEALPALESGLSQSLSGIF